MNVIPGAYLCAKLDIYVFIIAYITSSVTPPFFVLWAKAGQSPILQQNAWSIYTGAVIICK
jgi:hypothetical protein